MAERKDIIIGVDFGNKRSFPSFISDRDSSTRIGGIVHDLLPAIYGVSRQADGIPSTVFVPDREDDAMLYGEVALSNRAMPVDHRFDMLKRKLGKTVNIGGREVKYDDMITNLAQYIMEVANQRLDQEFQMMTNQIYLSYPATFSYAQRMYLVSLMEKAEVSIDGKKEHVKVVGTIAEPAAAALDYLSEFEKEKENTTVLVLDIGGGTTDIAILSAYPKGRKNENGDVYYYDLIDTDGIANLGGVEIDAVFQKLILKELKKKYADVYPDLERYFSKPRGRNELNTQTEEAKINLSTQMDAYVEFAPTLDDYDYISITVTRDMFYDSLRKSGLIHQVTDLVSDMIEKHPSQNPDLIVLTGGTCQMPIFVEELSKVLPEYVNQIKTYRPSRAISYGAARFGAVEGNPDGVLEKEKKKSVVQRRLSYDIGGRFFRDDPSDEEGYIITYLKAGTPIPCTSEWRDSYTLLDNARRSNVHIYEAQVKDPDPNHVNRDYRYIVHVVFDHGEKVPKFTHHDSRIVVDGEGNLTFEMRETLNPDHLLSAQTKLKSIQ